MHAPPAWCRLRLEPNGERKQDTAHEDSTRVDLLGDRRTGVGRGRPRVAAATPIRRRPPQRQSSSPSAPTTSASPTSPSDAAAADATAAIARLLRGPRRARARIRQADLKQLTTVATSTQLNAAEDAGPHVSAARVSARPATPAISELKVQSVNLDNSDPTAGKVPTVVIDVCWDVSKVDVLDKSGKSIVSPDRPDTGWTRYTVANYEYAADPTGGWRVATGQDLKQTPCAAS